MATVTEQIVGGVAILVIGAGGTQLWNSFGHDHSEEIKSAIESEFVPVNNQLDAIVNSLKDTIPGFAESYDRKVDTEEQRKAFE